MTNSFIDDLAMVDNLNEQMKKQTKKIIKENKISEKRKNRFSRKLSMSSTGDSFFSYDDGRVESNTSHKDIFEGLVNSMNSTPCFIKRHS